MAFGDQAHHPGFAGAGDEVTGGQGFHLENLFFFRCLGRPGSHMGDIAPKRVEFVFFEKVCDGGVVGIGQAHFFQAKGQFDIGLDGNQRLAKGHVRLRLTEHILLTGR